VRLDLHRLPLLVLRSIEPDAEIVHVPRDEVLAMRSARGPSASTLRALAPPIARGCARSSVTAESRGLEANARGFMHLGLSDHEQLRAELPVYVA
jgi:hypothetical protein